MTSGSTDVVAVAGAALTVAGAALANPVTARTTAVPVRTALRQNPNISPPRYGVTRDIRPAAHRIKTNHA
jgi:hypothetical protein